jgi:hypothetical protein
MYSKMRECLRSGAWGRPRYVSVDLWRRPYPAGRDGWRSDPRSRGTFRAEWHAAMDRSEHPGFSLEASVNNHLAALPLPSVSGALFELRAKHRVVS